jgi:pimeloyl-ACP methyl ester carboxylesterase
VRKPHPGEHPGEKYYPPGLSFPVTAFLRVLPDSPSTEPAGPLGHQAVLELYDPLATTDLAVEGCRVPLESDLTTPLAYFLDQGRLASLATLGLLKPDETQRLRGLYMAQPFEPGKIPVVFVHGLWSEPTTWSEMFNDLRSSPEIRAHYQFWFYFYPSGQPFWHSAAQLRKDLAELRAAVDPAGRFAALDQMVLVGHSMGGLVSKLQTLDSGDNFWQTASSQPLAAIKAQPDVRQALAETYYFRANPSIRRVITIGTPHRGSKFANSTAQFLGRKLIALPQMLLRSQEALYRDNPGVFPEDSSIRVSTSIESLAPESPFLPAMLAAHAAPWVKYHNVVGVTGLEDKQRLPDKATDGVVPYDSAHLDGVHSELPVAADHLGVHRHPLTVLEVRRILLEHLRDVYASSPAQPAAAQAARSQPEHASW